VFPPQQENDNGKLGQMEAIDSGDGVRLAGEL
jgi:hypothetical protein